MELHLRWAEQLLLNHHDAISASKTVYTAALRAMHQAFSGQMGDLAKLCHSNHYALAFLAPSSGGGSAALAEVEEE